MNIEMLSLAERIQRCREGFTAYPEYTPSIICRFGQTPISEYLAGLAPKRRQRLSVLLGSPGGEHTYQWAALRVAELSKRNPRAAAEAMGILAEPMIRYDEHTKRKAGHAHG